MGPNNVSVPIFCPYFLSGSSNWSDFTNLLGDLPQYVVDTLCDHNPSIAIVDEWYVRKYDVNGVKSDSERWPDGAYSPSTHSIRLIANRLEKGNLYLLLTSNSQWFVLSTIVHEVQHMIDIRENNIPISEKKILEENAIRAANLFLHGYSGTPAGIKTLIEQMYLDDNNQWDSTEFEKIWNKKGNKHRTFYDPDMVEDISSRIWDVPWWDFAKNAVNRPP